MNCDQSNEISGLSLRYCWRLIAKLRRSPTLKSENKLFSSLIWVSFVPWQFTCLTEQQLLTIVHFVGFKLSKASLRCPDWLLRGKSHTDFLQVIAWFPFFVLILLFCFDIQVRKKRTLSCIELLKKSNALNHFWLVSYLNIDVKECFWELKKALRDTLTQAAMCRLLIVKANNPIRLRD